MDKDGDVFIVVRFCFTTGIPVMRTLLQILFLIVVIDLPPSNACMWQGDKQVAHLAEGTFAQRGASWREVPYLSSARLGHPAGWSKTVSLAHDHPWITGGVGVAHKPSTGRGTQ